jgi:hypothetical protein
MDTLAKLVIGCTVALALGALAASGATADGDCLAPLRESTGWRCRADVPGGPPVAYCLEHTNVFGSDPADRTFKLVASGPYPSSCSCNAKGKSPGAAFGADKGFLCLYRDTDGVMSGRITKRRIAGQTFTPLYGIRSVFSCEPDPACDVQPVVDPDLTPESGAVELAADDQENVEVSATGATALGYLPGCGGYASEAPTFAFRIAATPSGTLRFQFAKVMGETDGAGILVVTPSGAAHCADNTVQLPAAEGGSYGVWVRATTPGAQVEGYVDGYLNVP